LINPTLEYTVQLSVPLFASTACALLDRRMNLPCQHCKATATTAIRPLGNGLKLRGLQKLFGIVTELGQYHSVDIVFLGKLLDPCLRQGGEIPDTTDPFLP
jgi:hypothetical protein